MIKVVIADDHAVLRKGIRAILEQAHNFAVMDEAQNGAEAVELTERLSPDVLILDMEMPVMDGISVVRTLKQKKSKTAILILSAHDDRYLIKESVENGAKGYILKEDAPDFIVRAIQRVFQGEKGVYSPGIQKKHKGLLDTA